jgi:Sec-independent protein translocase protein TatA
MFGIGAQEMVIIGGLLLVVFGPAKLPGMARDFGRFVLEARRSIEEFKTDLVPEEEGSLEPHEDPGTEQGPQAASGEPKNVRHEENAAVIRSAPPIE